MSNTPVRKGYAATKKILEYLPEILPTDDPNQHINDNNIVGVDDTERLEFQKDLHEQSLHNKNPLYFNSHIMQLENSVLPNIERITPHKMINYNLSDDNLENFKLVDHKSIHNTESLLKQENIAIDMNWQLSGEEHDLVKSDISGSNKLFEYRYTNNTIFNPNSEDSHYDQKPEFIVSNEFSSIHKDFGEFKLRIDEKIVRSFCKRIKILSVEDQNGGLNGLAQDNRIISNDTEHGETNNCKCCERDMNDLDVIINKFNTCK
jgi:hypothetical protein